MAISLRTTLLDWLERHDLDLEVTITESGRVPGAIDIDLDGDDLIGSISFQPDDRLAIRLLRLPDGEVLAVEELTIADADQLDRLLSDLLILRIPSST